MLLHDRLSKLIFLIMIIHPYVMLNFSEKHCLDTTLLFTIGQLILYLGERRKFSKVHMKATYVVGLFSLKKVAIFNCCCLLAKKLTKTAKRYPFYISFHVIIIIFFVKNSWNFVLSNTELQHILFHSNNLKSCLENNKTKQMLVYQHLCFP